jgi:TP901 family phage tail tape measure protein
MASTTFDLSVILKMVDKFSGPLSKAVSGFNSNIKKIKDTKSELKTFGANLQSIGKNLTLSLTAPIVGLGTIATKSAIDIESAFTGVIKTVNGLTKTELANLKKSLLEMSFKVPVAPTELMAIAEAAGQLGIQKENIVGFTKVMADLAATTDIVGGEGAKQMARFANIMQMSQTDFDKLGSSISYLGNNMAANESEILNMAMRLAGAGKTIGLTSAQVMGLSAALNDVGINAEAGGTAFTRIMMLINSQIGSGSKKIQSFAKISGKSVSEFEKMWKNNAKEALVSFVEGIGDLKSKGLNVSSILDAIGMGGIYMSDALLRASGAGDKLRKAISGSTQAWIDNNATTNEANLRYKTLESQLQMAKNRLIVMASTFGEAIMPAVKDVLDMLEPMVKWISELSPQTKKWIVKIAAVVAILGPIIGFLGMIAAAIGAIAALPAIGTIAAGLAIIGATVAGIVIAIRKWPVEFQIAISKMMIMIDIIKNFFTNAFDSIYNKAVAIIDKIIELGQKIKDFFINIPNIIGGMIPDSIKTFLGFSNGSTPISGFSGQTTIPQLISPQTMDRSRADINIKVTADQGAQAKVVDSKQSGNQKINIMHDSYLGLGAAGAGM